MENKDKNIVIKKIENKTIESYDLYLKERNKSSNVKKSQVRHSHVITVDDKKYSFSTRGKKQRVFKTDYFSFDFLSKNGHNNIDKRTIVTLHENG
jgi:hypothetical protein